jgi:hypothetical protein
MHPQLCPSIPLVAFLHDYHYRDVLSVNCLSLCSSMYYIEELCGPAKYTSGGGLVDLSDVRM